MQAHLVHVTSLAGNQLSTDDFLGPSPNNTNLALLGAIGTAAWGYIQYSAGE